MENVYLLESEKDCLMERDGVLSTSGLWMCFVPQMYMQELTKQREMLYTVELVCHIPNLASNGTILTD